MMGGFVFTVGPWWGRAAIGWSLQRLSHRGEGVRIACSSRRVLHAFGEAPLTTSGGGMDLWSWRIDPGFHEEVFRRRGENLLEEAIPEGGRSGLILLHDRTKGLVRAYRGLDCSGRICYARKGRSLLLTPESKALSNVQKGKQVGKLRRGWVLDFNSRTGDVQTRESQNPWEEAPRTELDYEGAKRELERVLEEGMREIGRRHPGRMALALSGGLDSSISAWLARRAGVECEAFTVWFDSGSQEPPPDLAGARLTAESLGIPLVSLRIGAEEIEELAKGAVYLLEQKYWRHVETGAYVLRLVRELKARGYRTVLTGLGGDGYFAGTGFGRKLGAGFQESMAAQRRHRVVLSRLAPAVGVGLLSPFHDAAVREFSLRLPPEYLLEPRGVRLRGKKILREIYAPRVGSPLAAETKDFPSNTAGGTALFEREWGRADARERRYGGWLEEMLKMPRFPRENWLARQVGRCRS